MKMILTATLILFASACAHAKPAQPAAPIAQPAKLEALDLLSLQLAQSQYLLAVERAKPVADQVKRQAEAVHELADVTFAKKYDYDPKKGDKVVMETGEIRRAPPKEEKPKKIEAKAVKPLVTAEEKPDGGVPPAPPTVPAKK